MIWRSGVLVTTRIQHIARSTAASSRVFPRGPGRPCLRGWRPRLGRQGTVRPRRSSGGNCRRPPIAVPRAGQRRRRRRKVRRRCHGSIRPGHRPAKAPGHPSVRIARPPFVAVGRALQPVAAGAPPACTHLSTSAVPGRALGPARFRRSRTEPYLAPGSLHDDYGEQTTPPPWLRICHVTNQKCALVRYVTLPERWRGGRHSVGEEPDGLGACPGVCA